MIDHLARFVIWSAIVIFSAVGLLGILFGPFEFLALIQMDFSSLEPTHLATFMGQQRFLKALELVAGWVLFTIRKDIFRVPALTRVTLVVFWATPLARVVSLAMDGIPEPSFVLLLAVEITGASIVLARALMAPQRARREAPSRGGPSPLESAEHAVGWGASTPTTAATAH